MLSALFAIGVLVAIALLGLERRFMHRRHTGGVDCAIRVTRGSIDGLSRRWRHGFAYFENGSMIWTLWTTPRRQVTLFLSPDLVAQRALRGSETWIVDRRCAVRTYALGPNLIEVALLPKRFEILQGGLSAPQ